MRTKNENRGDVPRLRSNPAFAGVVRNRAAKAAAEKYGIPLSTVQSVAYGRAWI